jgi:hypothetical protein
MDFKEGFSDFSVKHYKFVTVIMVIVTIVLGAFIPLIKIDTDPENMLAEDEPVRVFHDQVKEDFVIRDMVVVGIVNNEHPEGVFNPDSLSRIYELTQFSKNLVWEDPDDPNEQVGVVEVDLLAPSTVDYIGQGGPGTVKFEWLMQFPPDTQEGALEVRERAMSNPLLKDTVVSEDGEAISLYLPITSKDLSHRVYQSLQKKIATFDGEEEFHITGLPVAEDTFGYEMFIQMAISAPTAMAVIFILMLIFFRKLVLVISPMIVAMVSVITTMGLLIGFGFPVHIMSSMIPIFLMPIAVVDSIHILSEFFDVYTPQKGRKESIKEVMHSLFVPMLYTSLTSAAGFASLALTPIPPVQVFGVFVAIGIMIAWLVTVTFVPAYAMMISDKYLEGFGAAAVHEEKENWLTKLLGKTGVMTYRRSKFVIVGVVVLSVVAVYGITQIQINDNPIKWFEKDHPIRRADTELNRHFAGTYMAYLVLEDKDSQQLSDSDVSKIVTELDEFQSRFPDSNHVVAEVVTELKGKSGDVEKEVELYDRMLSYSESRLSSASEEQVNVWYELIDFWETRQQSLQIFKDPEMLRYISRLEDYLDGRGVGKTNSISDIVKKVYQELVSGEEKDYRIPDSSQAVAQSLMQFQSSHTPDDLWHFISYDYKSANLWLQLKSGDNKDMEKVVEHVDNFFAENPPPRSISHRWAGLTYINVIWQNKMVWGMLQSFMGSFLIVFMMMSVLFRSSLWGIICMIPLTVTIVFIYGMIGLVGKDYDMPVAVLSALTLGMAVDFAIHFLERARASFAKTHSWKESSAEMFGEPAHAISRNVLVIAIGFLPLLAAPLVPYKTVGVLLCLIMALSGAVTLLVLPSIIRLASGKLFKGIKNPVSPGCNCVFCLIISLSAVILIAVNLHQYWQVGWSKFALVSVILVPLLVLGCGMLSRREKCSISESENEKSNS